MPNLIENHQSAPTYRAVELPSFEILKMIYKIGRSQSYKNPAGLFIDVL